MFAQKLITLSKWFSFFVLFCNFFHLIADYAYKKSYVLPEHLLDALPPFLRRPVQLYRGRCGQQPRENLNGLRCSRNDQRYPEETHVTRCRAVKITSE